LFVEYVYLSQPERDWFKKNTLVYLTHSFQRLQFKVPTSTTQTTYTYYTEFVNDVKELFWIIQSDAASNVYDYGNHLVNLQLTLNNQDFITNDYASAQYLHVLQPLQYHTRVPNGNYYMYSFALEPENEQPTGEMNMTNITRQQHSLTLTASPSSERNLRMYAHSYNLFTIKGGDGVTLNPMREGGTAPFSSGIFTPPPPPPPPSLPDAVTGFVANFISETEIDLIWDVSSGATSYSIVISPAVVGPISTSGTSWSYTGLSPGTAYTFTITPSNVYGNGPPTNLGPVYTLFPPLPDAVTGFAVNFTYQNGFDLIWNAAPGATSYAVDLVPPYYAWTTSYTYMYYGDLTPDTAYTFTITPSNVSGNGPPTILGPVYTLFAPTYLTYTGTIETLSLPPGSYNFEIAGGSGPLNKGFGGSYSYGARSYGTLGYTVTSRITIQYAIGQASPGNCGGAGGTFVYDMTNSQMLFVAGGAGSYFTSLNPIDTDPLDGSGGSAGYGGGSGAGVNSNGSDSLVDAGTGGLTFGNGSAGGTGGTIGTAYAGGFGGGGGGTRISDPILGDVYYVGGGGGYTGGTTTTSYVPEVSSSWYATPGRSYAITGTTLVDWTAGTGGGNVSQHGYLNIIPV
jgi:hypothetical protein